MRKIKLMPVNEGHELPSNGIFIEVDDETAKLLKYGHDIYTYMTFRIDIENSELNDIENIENNGDKND